MFHTGAHNAPYRKISFVPVRDTGQRPPPGLLVPLLGTPKAAAAAGDGPGDAASMPGLRNSEVDALLQRNGGKVQEYYKEGHVSLRWVSVKRAVSAPPPLPPPPLDA